MVGRIVAQEICALKSLRGATLLCYNGIDHEKGEIFMLIDMHAHSSSISRCCKITAEDAIKKTLETGMDGLVLTNHYQKSYVSDGDYSGFAKRYMAECEQAELLGEKLGCKVFWGIEVTVERYPKVHMLIYGVDKEFLLRHPMLFDYTQQQLYRAVKENGGVLIQAHPFRNGTSVLDTKYLDGIEVNCHPKYESTHQAELFAIAEKEGLRVTCGGDFHNDTHRPCCGMYLPDDLQNSQQLGQYLADAQRVKLCVQETDVREHYDIEFTVKSPKLIGQFWGTSAAEGVPAPFCQCATCREAREHPAFQRLRTCFRLTDKIMVDLGADAVSQSIKYGQISKVEHVLVTHTHDDHLNPHMMMEAFWCKEQRNTLHYYFTDRAYDIVQHWRRNDWILKGMVPMWEEQGIVAFHKLEYGKRYEIEGVGVTPFKGNHVGNVRENSALYLLELPDGRTLFYGLDSGPYFPETLEALRQYHIDLFVSECAFGRVKCPHAQHMDIHEVRELVDQLLQQGTLDQNSALYITHINHGTSHNGMLEAVAQLDFPIPTTVCLDGMNILHEK